MMFFTSVGVSRQIVFGARDWLRYILKFCCDGFSKRSRHLRTQPSDLPNSSAKCWFVQSGCRSMMRCNCIRSKMRSLSESMKLLLRSVELKEHNILRYDIRTMLIHGFTHDVS